MKIVAKKVVFETFLKNGVNRIGKKVFFDKKTPAMWGVYSEVLMAYPQNNFFSYPVYAVFEKILKNHFFSDYFQNRAFLAVFETFLRSRVSLTLPSLASRHKLFYSLF